MPLLIIAAIVLFIALTSSQAAYGGDVLNRPVDSFFAAEITAASKEFGIREEWIRGFIEIESSWNPNAYRYEPRIDDASIGLMQVLTNTAKNLGFRGSVAELYKPGVNIRYGTKLLAENVRRFGDNLARVGSAYNSGQSEAYLSNPAVTAYVAKLQKAVTRWS